MRGASVPFAALAVLISAPATRADGPSLPGVELHAYSFAGGAIELGQRGATRTLTVDAARSVTLLVTAGGNVRVSLRLPDGSTLDGHQGRDDRVGWQEMQGRLRAAADVFPGLGTGFNTIVTIKRPARGSYTLSVNRASDGKASIPFVATLILDSDLRMGIWGSATRVLRGAALVLGVALLDGSAPARDAKVVARLLRDPAEGSAAAEPLGEVTLTDDGQHGDAKARDGMFTALVTPPTAGTFRLAIHATGNSSAAGPFERMGGVTFLASEPSLRIRRGQAAAKAKPLPRGTLAVSLDLDGGSGTYDVVAQLRSKGGAAVSEHRLVSVDRAAHVEIVFDAARLAESGDAPPFTLAGVDAYQVTTDDRVLRGRLEGALLGAPRGQPRK